MPAGRRRRVNALDFAGGIDRRTGLYGESLDRFQELTNFVTTPGKKIKRRPPVRKLDGKIGSSGFTKELVYLDGVYYAFRKKGDPDDKTLTGLTVSVLLFDNPDYCTTWSVIDVGTVNDVIVALIRHTFPGSTVTSRIMLHVFDRKTNRPTYVEDPWCPTNYGPEFPLHAYGTGTISPAFKDYTPAMDVVANKLHLSRPDANVAFSAVNRPRVWNNRTGDMILANGEWFYFINPNTGTALKNFIVARPFSELSDTTKWASYILEYYDPSTKKWVQYTELAAGTYPSSEGQWCPFASLSRFGGPDEIDCIVYDSTPDRVIRLRLIAKKAPVQVITGCVLDPKADATISEGKILFEGATIAVSKYTALANINAGDYRIYVDKSGTSGWELTSAALTGQLRYNRLYSVIMTAPGGTKAFTYALSGTVAVTSGSDLVTGSTTAFQTEIAAGDTIIVNGQVRKVKLIVSGTSLQADLPFTESGSGVTAVRQKFYPYSSDDTGNQWYADKTSDVLLNEAGGTTTGYLNSAAYDVGGGTPTAVGKVKNRLLVQFAASTQLWQVDPDPLANKFLATINAGTSPNTHPIPIEVNGSILSPTATGPRAFTVVGYNYDGLSESNLGLMLRGEVFPDLTAAAWWPINNQYVCAGTKDGKPYIIALSVYQDQKVNAWSKWEVDTTATIKRFLSVTDRLYFTTTDGEVFYFDASATSFTDSGVTGTTAYQSFAKWQFNQFGDFTSMKRFVFIDVVQSGHGSWGLFVNPQNPNDMLADFDIAPIAGGTIGTQRVPLCALVPALALSVSSTDDTGYELEQVALEYVPLSR